MEKREVKECKRSNGNGLKKKRESHLDFHPNMAFLAILGSLAFLCMFREAWCPRGVGFIFLFAFQLFCFRSNSRKTLRNYRTQSNNIIRRLESLGRRKRRNSRL